MQNTDCICIVASVDTAHVQDWAGLAGVTTTSSQLWTTAAADTDMENFPVSDSYGSESSLNGNYAFVFVVLKIFM